MMLSDEHKAQLQLLQCYEMIGWLGYKQHRGRSIELIKRHGSTHVTLEVLEHATARWLKRQIPDLQVLLEIELQIRNLCAQTVVPLRLQWWSLCDASETFRALMRFVEDHDPELIALSRDLPIYIAEQEGVFYVLLEAEAGVTSPCLRKTIPKLMRWRRLISAFQGPCGNGAIALREQWRCRHASGAVSYAQLAAEINQTITTHLQNYVELRRKKPGCGMADLESVGSETVGSMYKKQTRGLGRQWVIEETLDIGRSERMAIYSILRAVGWTEAKITQLVLEGAKYIAEGVPLFANDYPISRENVIDLLRYRRRWNRGSRGSARVVE